MAAIRILFYGSGGEGADRPAFSARQGEKRKRIASKARALRAVRSERKKKRVGKREIASTRLKNAAKKKEGLLRGGRLVVFSRPYMKKEKVLRGPPFRSKRRTARVASNLLGLEEGNPKSINR